MCRACRVEPDPERKPAVVAHLGLHAHTCSACGLLRTCYRNPCPHRGRGDNVRDSRHAGTLEPWICFVCVDAAAKTEVKTAVARSSRAARGGRAHARKVKRVA